MGFALGYLVGTFGLLLVVVYLTRIRGGSIPGVPEDGEARFPRAGGDRREPCELCDEARFCEEVKGMTVCSDCRADLL